MRGEANTYQDLDSLVVSEFDDVALESADTVGAGYRACHLERCHAHALTLDVGVLDQVVGLQPAVRVRLQHASYYLLSAGGLRLVHAELATLDLLVEVLFARAAEGELTSKHHVEQNAEGPNIDRHSFVVLFASNLRGHVAGGATEHLEPLVRRIH